MQHISFYAILNPATAGPVLDVEIDLGEQLLRGDDGILETLSVTSEPRRLPLPYDADMLDVLDWGDCLARLTPRGPVRTHPDGPHRHICNNGWTITGWESPDPVFGPQAPQLRALMAELDELDGDGPVADAYADTADARFGDYDQWLPQPHADAARAALAAAGIDGQWWAETADPCTMRGELLAVAARDLLGTADGWDWDAYTALLAPWRTAVGRWPHPHDARRAENQGYEPVTST